MGGEREGKGVLSSCAWEAWETREGREEGLTISFETFPVSG